jgi:hypothetical protein
MDMLRSVGKYAGPLLMNETFTLAVFDYMVVPGVAMAAEDLRAMAPAQLKTL